MVCAWTGRLLLQILGISVPMLQAAGGLIRRRC
jgi:small neutral amino acid transporter SnatA (MarC family)